MCPLTDSAAAATRAPDQFGGDALNNDSMMLRLLLLFQLCGRTKHLCLLD